MIGLFVIMLFAAMQGLAVFGTAALAANLLTITGWPGKIGAMALSYIGWITLTIGGYLLFGGEGGLMDGFGLILMLCFTALVSSIIYALVWVAAPSHRKTDNG